MPPWAPGCWHEFGKILRDLARQDREYDHPLDHMLHNVFVLPEGLDEQSLLHARLVRDADKLDIMRVVLEYFSQDAGEQGGGRCDRAARYPGHVHSGCFGKSDAGRDGAEKSLLATQNDFKLLQLTWLYDLNFISSLRIVQERDYIGKIEEMLLPETSEIHGWRFSTCAPMSPACR